MPDFSPEVVHGRLLAAAPRMLRFDPEAYPPEWVSAARRTFKQLLGAMPAPCEPAVRVTRDEVRGGAREIDFILTAEPGADVPCTLAVPVGAERPAVMVCLEGHGSSVQVALGNAEEEWKSPGLDFARQAVARGFAALCIEQRGFGTRRDAREPEGRYFGNACTHAASVALMLGRTLVGQRVCDVMRALDVLAVHLPGRRDFPALDTARIGVVGHSGGGTVACYAAAVDLRISAVIASCCVCTYAASIGRFDHCVCNYLPGVMAYFEMADIAGLIVPRPLVVVAGEKDQGFPIAGVRAAMADIEACYPVLGGGGKVRLVVGGEGHRFYEDAAWRAFRELTGW